MGNHAFACWHDVPDQPALCQRAQPCNRSSGGQFDLSRVICGDRFVSVLCGIYSAVPPRGVRVEIGLYSESGNRVAEPPWRKMTYLSSGFSEGF